MILKNYDRKLLPELPELVRTNVGGKRHYQTPNGSYPSIQPYYQYEIKKVYLSGENV